MKKISLFVVVLALTTLSTRAQYYYRQNSSYKRNFVEDIYEVSIICKSSINFLNG